MAANGLGLDVSSDDIASTDISTVPSPIIHLEWRAFYVFLIA